MTNQENNPPHETLQLIVHDSRNNFLFNEHFLSKFNEFPPQPFSFLNIFDMMNRNSEIISNDTFPESEENIKKFKKIHIQKRRKSRIVKRVKCNNFKEIVRAIKESNDNQKKLIIKIDQITNVLGLLTNANEKERMEQKDRINYLHKEIEILKDTTNFIRQWTYKINSDFTHNLDQNKDVKEENLAFDSIKKEPKTNQSLNNITQEFNLESSIKSNIRGSPDPLLELLKGDNNLHSKGNNIKLHNEEDPILSLLQQDLER